MPTMVGCRRSLWTGCWAVCVAVLLACAQSVPAATYEGFSDPHEVMLSGYAGSAMEPEISPDGAYLLFNTSNVSPNIPALQIAARSGPDSFEYDGPLPGEAVNEPGQLSATPSVDREGNLYFVSSRTYVGTLATVYAARFAAASATDVHAVPGVAAESPGFVDFDVAVSPDGRSLFVSVGDFRSGTASAAHITLYERSPTGFAPDPAGKRLLHAVNKAGALDYAAAVSPDGLELFFTRAVPARGAKGLPAVYRASRARPGKPFGHVQRVAAISGFAEAPSLSDDGQTLYYHELRGGTFRIMAVTRTSG